MVRLKVTQKFVLGLEIGEFQFQYGAIKSKLVNGKTKRIDMFQFQYGAIKRMKLSHRAKET